MKIKYIVIILIFLVFGFIYAQDNASAPENEKTAEENETAEKTDKPQELPPGFMNLKLGLTMNELEEALNENTYFDYRGKPDVDMRLSKERTLIECSGFSYVKKGYFQFYKERLIIITIMIDEKELDFYSFYRNLENKYGKPDNLNPEGVYWKNGQISMALEKPLSVKYTDLKAFAEIKENSAAKTSKQKILKEDFIETF